MRRLLLRCQVAPFSFLVLTMRSKLAVALGDNTMELFAVSAEEYESTGKCKVQAGRAALKLTL